MEIVIHKLGGSSVADTEKLFNVCKHIIREKDNGKEVIVVVSAQGKTTDNLINQEKEIMPFVNKREHDVLVSVGEQITISKLVMCLSKLGREAVSYLGFQVPIITDSNFGDANILRIDTRKVMNDLQHGKIVVVAGFQGIDEYGNITTLGRGGSDTTAIALAAALGTHKCDIYKDVDGVYTQDPHVHNDAVKYDYVSYDKVLEMANSGARILHNKCVQLAKQYNVDIMVRSTFKDNVAGTIVTNL